MKKIIKKNIANNVPPKKEFFIFYLKIPPRLKNFLVEISLLFLLGFFAAGYLFGNLHDDPGRAGFRGDLGRQTVLGILQLKPYPTLWVTAGSQNIKTGRTIMLAGIGKNGIGSRGQFLDGELVKAQGILIKRGDLDMLQLLGGKRGLDSVNEQTHQGSIQVLAPTIELGTWKINGEICDGKCLAGAMNPGRGLAHKACANLCLLGEVPPVFVSSQKVLGENFFLLANQRGGAINESTYDYIGQMVEITGELERRGDLLILKIANIQ